MKKAAAFVLLLLVSSLLFAQYEDEEEPEQTPGWVEQDVYSTGDQSFSIAAGVLFPVLFFNNGETITNNLFAVGGYGSLSYTYFLGAHFFLGGEISLSFIATESQNNMLYLIPIGLRAGYQFVIWRFEIPLTYTIGFNWHRYLGYGNFGLYMKAGVSLFYRFNPEWSYGLNASWCWFPEWTGDPSKNVDGHMIELTLSVRYHF
jgi:hypothetical protein